MALESSERRDIERARQEEADKQHQEIEHLKAATAQANRAPPFVVASGMRP